MYHHGGEIYGQTIVYDFSVNLNPLGMPEQVQDFLTSSEVIHYSGIYPQNGNEQLAEAIAQKEAVRSGQVICGNGASELIYAVFSALPPGRVLLCTPGFSEYEQAAKAYGWEIIYYETKEKDGFQIHDEILELLKESKPELTVLCQPSNPVGNCIRSKLLEQIVKTLDMQGGRLFVDECFLDFLPDGEMRTVKKFFDKAGNPQNEGNEKTVFILKAFTKIYSMPGLRLGYLLSSSEEVAECIRKKLPDWNVSSIAQQAGLLALADGNYLKKTRELVWAERKYLVVNLKQLGVTVYDGEANFILWKAQSGLKEILQERGILIRDCSNFRGLETSEDSMTYYRTAVKSRVDNDVLIGALKTAIQSGNICKR